MIADIAPNILVDLLHLLSDPDDAHILSRRPVSIPIHRILAMAWNSGRLADCARRLAAGEQAPPVLLSRYRLQGQNWYIVSDGHHRTIAARNAGRKRIRAVVGAETPCRPELYWIDEEGRLWRRVVGEGVSVQVRAGIDDDLRAALLAVGVRETEAVAMYRITILGNDKRMRKLLSGFGREDEPGVWECYLSDSQAANMRELAGHYLAMTATG